LLGGNERAREVAARDEIPPAVEGRGQLVHRSAVAHAPSERTSTGLGVKGGPFSGRFCSFLARRRGSRTLKGCAPSRFRCCSSPAVPTRCSGRTPCCRSAGRRTAGST